MTPASPLPEGTSTGRSLHLHIDRRRMVVLGVAGGFLGIAIVFGALAYFQAVPTPGGTTNISVPVTTAVTVTPSAVASSPTGGETGPPIPTSPAVVTITATRIVSVPQASAGSNLGAIES